MPDLFTCLQGQEQREGNPRVSRYADLTKSRCILRRVSVRDILVEYIKCPLGLENEGKSEGAAAFEMD